MGTSAAPALNAHVDLLPTGVAEWVASRVEDLVDGEVLVAAPDGSAPEPGAAVTLFWLDGDRPFEQATTLAAVDGDRLPRWRLRPIGSARPVTRRAYFRVSLTAPVELLGAHPVDRATLIDLSEGGLRCHLRSLDGPPVGSELQVALELGGRRVVARATVVRREAHDLGTHVSLRFVELPTTDADAIRHRLFAEQRRLRARGLA